MPVMWQQMEGILTQQPHAADGALREQARSGLRR